MTSLLDCAPSSPRPLLSVDDLHGIRDHSLIEEYFDAIDQLLNLVRDEQMPPDGRREKALELCNNIAALQEVSKGAIAHAVSVRSKPTCASQWADGGRAGPVAGVMRGVRSWTEWLHESIALAQLHTGPRVS